VKSSFPPKSFEKGCLESDIKEASTWKAKQTFCETQKSKTDFAVKKRKKKCSRRLDLLRALIVISWDSYALIARTGIAGHRGRIKIY